MREYRLRPERDTTLVPGTRLGPYEIVNHAASGGMGEVYKARDTRLNRTVAIKVLPEGFSADAEHRQRFEREARVVASLSHPHVCALYDLGAVPANVPGEAARSYLVMEYLEGETLSERLTRGALPTDQVGSHGAAIARALDAAHRQHIVHRDLKPGNVMLTAEVMVAPFPSGPGATVSIAGGRSPRWSADGRELFFIAADGELMAAPIRVTPALEVGRAARLFTTDTTDGPWGDYAVTPEGRFMAIVRTRIGSQQPMTVIVNWPATLPR